MNIHIYTTSLDQFTCGSQNNLENAGYLSIEETTPKHYSLQIIHPSSLQGGCNFKLLSTAKPASPHS